VGDSRAAFVAHCARVLRAGLPQIFVSPRPITERAGQVALIWRPGRAPHCREVRLKLGYDVTPNCMRRTYQDFARAADLADIVTHSISGHATPEMQRHYSTVSGDEMRAALGEVVDVIDDLAIARVKRSEAAARAA